MKEALKELLNTLDAIAETHDELSDTDVTEALADTLNNAYIDPVAGYAVPKSFGMFSPAADSLVHSAMNKFLSAARSQPGPRTPRERLDAFQDKSVKSVSGHTYRDYFGHIDETLWQDYLATKRRDQEFGFKTGREDA